MQQTSQQQHIYYNYYNKLATIPPKFILFQTARKHLLDLTLNLLL